MAPRTDTEAMGRVAGGVAECRAVYAFMNHSPVGHCSPGDAGK
jgi:hypothetical protein